MENIPPRSGAPEPGAPTVMLVADHEDSAEMYAVALKTMGFQPVTARTAEEAYAQASVLRPDVIVADVTLPGSSGLELTRRLRADAQTSDTGIIVLTGHIGPAIERQADDAGCDRFLLKPCMPDALALEIRDVLARRHDASKHAHIDDDRRPQPSYAAAQGLPGHLETRSCSRFEMRFS
jgi:two-component system, cell cycle response regulator DivK